MNILIPGGASDICSFVVEVMIQQGQQVTSLGNLAEPETLMGTGTEA